MAKPQQLSLHRPATLKDVADQSDSLEAFGHNLRDWQHEVSRLVTTRLQLFDRFAKTPALLSTRFKQGEIADAYLAAYAEWLAIKAKLEPPSWTKQKSRSLSAPWYSSSNHKELEKLAPESFSRRGVFTAPENVFRPKPGRPRVSAETKRLKAIARQRAYRERVKSILDQARSIGIK